MLNYYGCGCVLKDACHGKSKPLTLHKVVGIPVTNKSIFIKPRYSFNFNFRLTILKSVDGSQLATPIVNGQVLKAPIVSEETAKLMNTNDIANLVNI